MDNNLKEIIKTQYESLPDTIKKAIHDADLPAKLQSIGKKHSLLLDQMGDLETETTLVLFGLESIGDFIPNIKKALNVPDFIANKIASDVNDEVFHEIRESLQEMADLDKSEEGSEPENEEAILKEDILHEIENPIPAKTYAKEGPRVEAIIDPRNELPAGTMSPRAGERPVPKAGTPGESRNLPPQLETIDKKLGNPTVTPAVTGKNTPQKKNYKVDPYREPI